MQPLPQRMADLAVSQSALPNPVTNEHLVTWTLRATNQGPNDARGVYLTDILPTGVTIASISNSFGPVVQSPGGLRCVVGNLNAGSNLVVTLGLMVTNAGTLTNSVTVAHYETDPLSANNGSVLAVVALPNPSLAPPAGLVGWWPADGSAGDLVGTNHGVLMGGATCVPGKSGQAFSFNGSSAYVDLGRRSPGTKWSLEAWVNFSATLSGRRAIIGCEADL